MAMETKEDIAAAGTVDQKEEIAVPNEDIEFLWKWRKNHRRHATLLATLVASVTYVAGLNPPGGVRSDEEDTGGQGHRVRAVYPNRVGDPVLVSTYNRRYTAFFYSNAAAFVASLVVIIFLLDKRISGTRVGVTVLRSAMLLDLLALMAAFAAGSCRDVVASIYVSGIFALVFVYVAVHVSLARLRSKLPRKPQDGESLELKERRKFLLLLATFATPLTYGAGLVPPGGFWSKDEDGHRAGAPLLHDGPYKIRYHTFFYANATSFVASLAIIMLLMSRTLSGLLAPTYALTVCVLVELVGLMAAFAAGSCRLITTTAYIISLVGAVLLYIAIAVACRVRVLTCANFPDTEEATSDTPPARQEEETTSRPSHNNNGAVEVKQPMPNKLPESGDNAIANAPTDTPSNTGNNVTANAPPETDDVEESRSLLLLLATLAATVTYQAGLSPPGGVWPEGHPDHFPGNPVLMDMHPARYKVFYHCNTAAFVASLVVIIIVQSKELSSGVALRRAALNIVMILDLFGLMGAYVAGSCRDSTTTIYVFALAVAVFVYSIAKAVTYTTCGQSEVIRCVQRLGKKLAQVLLRRPPGSEGNVAGIFSSPHKYNLKKKRKFLLKLAILAATVTYQSGLNPPGGFWPESNEIKELTAGDPVLLDYYWTRYQVFFYCNATGFMASITVILILVNQKLYKDSIRSNALHVCMMVGLLGLMGAYAAGSCRKLRTSIYVFALVAAVITFLILQILLYASADRHRSPDKTMLRTLPTGPEEVPAGRCRWSDLPCLRTLSMGPATAVKNKNKKVTAGEQKELDMYLLRKYLMLLGILGASVTYQAGLAPPGGTWGDDDDTAPSPSPSAYPSVAGNPILLDSNAPRYQAFFYCNATSFVASVVVIMLLLQPTVKKHGAQLRAMQTAVVLDLLGLLGAYAAGSCRDWETSAYVIALVGVVVIFITLYVLLSFDVVQGKEAQGGEVLQRRQG